MHPAPAEVRRLAALARLPLSDVEAAALARDLRGILAHLEALRAAELDAPPVPPAAPDASALREDVPGSDALLLPPAAFAPAWRDGLFLAHPPGPGAAGEREGE